jgi:hypothetical protein
VNPLCASLDGFTLHAATRAGALDSAGREALLRYVLRPPVAQERVEQRPDGLVRITLKKAYRDGTIAVDMDPLSLLCRLQGRMKLLALVKGPASIARYLATVGEATEVPRRSPGRGPPYWKSHSERVLEPWSPAFAGLSLYYPSRLQITATLLAFIDFLRGEGLIAGGGGRRRRQG